MPNGSATRNGEDLKGSEMAPTAVAREVVAELRHVDRLGQVEVEKRRLVGDEVARPGSGGHGHDQRAARCEASGGSGDCHGVARPQVGLDHQSGWAIALETQERLTDGDLAGRLPSIQFQPGRDGFRRVGKVVQEQNGTALV